MRTRRGVTILRAGLASTLLCMLGAFGVEAQSAAGGEAGSRIRLGAQGDSPEVNRDQATRTIAKAAGTGWVTGMAVSQLAFLVKERSFPFSEKGLTYLSAGAFWGLTLGLVAGVLRSSDRNNVPAAVPAEVPATTGSSLPQARSWVRLRTVGGSVFEGAVRSRSPDELHLMTSQGEHVTVPFASIEALELHQGRRRQPLRYIAEGVLGGAFLGGLVGLVTDRVTSWGCVVGSCSERRVFRYARRGAFEGLVAGAAAAVLFRPHRWESVPLNAPSLIVEPHPGGGISLGLTAPF